MALHRHEWLFPAPSGVACARQPGRDCRQRARVSAGACPIRSVCRHQERDPASLHGSRSRLPARNRVRRLQPHRPIRRSCLARWMRMHGPSFGSIRPTRPRRAHRPCGLSAATSDRPARHATSGTNPSGLCSRSNLPKVDVRIFAGQKVLPDTPRQDDKRVFSIPAQKQRVVV